MSIFCPMALHMSPYFQDRIDGSVSTPWVEAKPSSLSSPSLSPCVNQQGDQFYLWQPNLFISYHQLCSYFGLSQHRFPKSLLPDLMPLLHYQKAISLSPLWLPIALISIEIKCQGPTVLPETQPRAQTPCKSWLLGGRSQSASLTFGFCPLQSGDHNHIRLWKRITYRPLVGASPVVQW